MSKYCSSNFPNCKPVIHCNGPDFDITITFLNKHKRLPEVCVVLEQSEFIILKYLIISPFQGVAT